MSELKTKAAPTKSEQIQCETLEREETEVVSGDQAIAIGARTSGVQFITGYPGSPITGILELSRSHSDIKCQWAQNEKVALEIGIGASHAGARSLVVMKHVGLNVAADPLFNVAYTGIDGGLVIVVGDDPGAKGSQNEQDTRLFAQAAGVPVLEPSTVEEAYLYTSFAFDLSERYDLPVIIRVNARLCYSKQRISIDKKRENKKNLEFATPTEKYLLLPKNVKPRHKVRNSNLEKFVHDEIVRETYKVELPEKKGSKFSIGIIVAGDVFQTIKEVFGTHFPILKIGAVFPVNSLEILKFSQLCDKVIVAEESSNFLELQVRNSGIKTVNKIQFDGVGEFALSHLYGEGTEELNAIISKHINIKSDTSFNELPPRTSGFCAGCSHPGVFQVLKELELYVVGDIGCITIGALPPFNALHANLCMGASIGILHGYLSVMDKEASKKAVAVIGDSTFFHSGINSLLSLANLGSSATIIISDNSGSAMTGLQQTNLNFDSEGWHRLLNSIGVKDVHTVSALDLKEVRRVITNSTNSLDLSVCVLLGECAQTKKETIYRYTINQHTCTQCSKCLDANCQGFSLQDGLISITDSCIGCGFCSQLCPEGAIIPRSVDKFVRGNRLASKLASKIHWYRLTSRLREISLLDRGFKLIENRFLRKQKLK
jgi:indolepyruvate ferredoxin oxidoreductase, alpha subunit